MKSLLTSIGRIQWPKLRFYLSTALVFLVAGVMIAYGGGASAELDSNAAEARGLFTKFVAAQNAHDADQVKSMLWNSPDMLLFSRGIEARGTEAAVDRFTQYYQGTWHLEPDMANLHTAVISNDVVQILVPIVFTRSLPGGQPQSNTFLVCQTFVRDGHGWVIASILPVANTRLK
ncbi:nuclear transport factor 2 family protein [Bradyrhizobium sp. Tv2a-2]|uniref:YybH family protein n=1 Tax=Bradyrhizobium sp. Tv2a-2 TaxID=113395 RepID=UPI000412DC3B|nr:nuclear transport factor 2 family protein [Bradyrhizobium sp. Tv2a-2]